MVKFEPVTMSGGGTAREAGSLSRVELGFLTYICALLLWVMVQNADAMTGQCFAVGDNSFGFAAGVVIGGQWHLVKRRL